MMLRSFESLGFLSPEVDQFRSAERARLGTEFGRVEQLVETAIADLRPVTGTAASTYLVGIAFWLRSIESCEGVVLLAERGLPTSPYAVLRIALECLFAACALWRKPEVEAKIEAWHHEERVKQARQMLAEGAETRLPQEQLIQLKAIAAERVSPSGWSHWEAASAAHLKFEYATMYRGLGIAGAHASARSLDEFHTAHADGSLDLHLQPTNERLAWVLSLVVTCLCCGIGRHREARSSDSKPGA